jgi:hypothetical protein
MNLEEYCEENKELNDNNSSIIKLARRLNHQITRSVDESPKNIIMNKALSKNSVILEGPPLAGLSLVG